jgi:XRE family transcriptional regulator, regulator of sulfur utilization
MNRALSAVGALLALCACAHAETAHTAATAPEAARTSAPQSAVIDWSEMAVTPTQEGERRALMNGPSRTLDNLEIHITTLNPGQTSHPPHRHANEEVVIVDSGALEVYLNGVTKRVGPGAVLVFMSNDWHNVTNAGTTPATYHVINWATPKTAEQHPAD